MKERLETTGYIERKLLFEKKNENIYCIGSRTSDRYLYAPSKEADIVFFILHNIDVGRTLCEIEKKGKEKYGLSKEDIKAVIEKGKQSGLIKTEKGEKTKRSVDEFELMLVNLKDFSLKGLYPVFDCIKKNYSILFAVMIFIIGIAILTLFSNDKWIYFPWREIYSNPYMLIYMWVIQFISLVLHEFAHAAVGYRYGTQPKTFSIAIFYYCMAIFYIKLPGIYFRERKERIKIWSAGIFMNFFLAACFLIAFTFSDNNLRLFYAVGVLSNILLAMGNTFPFFYSDGYYILSTFLSVPNLRKKSFFQIRDLMRSKVTKQNSIYWIYLVIAIVASGIIFGSQIAIIGHSLYSSILAGKTAAEILRDYSNIFIITSIGILVKIVGRIRKLHEKGA